MKVMQLISSIHHDESERGIYATSNALAKLGHQSIIVGDNADKNSEMLQRLIRGGAIYHALPMPKKSWWALRQVLRLRALIAKHEPDVIHIHSRTPAWILHWALRPYPEAMRPKMVATLYGFYPLSQYTRALFDADVLISVSESVDDYFRTELRLMDEFGQPRDAADAARFFQSELICMPRGVDVRKYPYRHQTSVHWLQHTFAEHPELEHKKWLLFPKTIGPEHGQAWLIDILGNLKEKFPNIHAIIMDEDPEIHGMDDIYYEEFIQRLSALGLSDRVTFVGRRPIDKKEWLASANIVLALATHPESIGMTALQAIHLGTPVVGWSQGAYAEILKDLFPQGLIKEQTALSLCKTVKFLLSNKIRPAITYEYTMDEMVDDTIAIYEKLAGITPKKTVKEKPKPRYGA